MASGQASAAAAPVEASPVFGKTSEGYSRYAVLLLMVIYAFCMLDRQVISILNEPIKNDLHLADWQIGAMSGLAFGVFYTLFGIPIARLAERGHRPFIIASATAIWSAFTAVCGLTQNFVQLLAARVGVGVGEAGCTPAAMSLISDYVPKEKRGSAIALYMIGGPIGALAGLAVGGLVASYFGWRATFILIGLPGLLIAAIAARTLREPRFKTTWKGASSAERKASFRADFAELAHKRAYWLIVASATGRALNTYGTQAFLGSFFLRNHHDELTRIAEPLGLNALGLLGLFLGATLGVGGIFGTWFGGYLTDRLAVRDVRAYVTVPALGALIAIPFGVAGFLVDSALLALALLGLAGVSNLICTGPSHASVVGLVKPSCRATAVALMLFIVNLIGLGLGPLGAGLLSDAFAAISDLGSGGGVRWSMVVFAFVGLISAATSWAARGSFVKDSVS